MWKFRFILVLLMAVALSCKKDKVSNDNHHFPDHIAPLLQTNCATAGCHSSQSSVGAGGLSLETWEDLFKGARGGSAVIPYSAEESFIFQFLNTDTSWGLVTEPTMPLGGTPYSPLELQEIIDWINAGARNHEGVEPFPPSASRRKWYVVNRECDLVTVFDAVSRQIMKVVKIGSDDVWTEGPNQLLFSPDRQTWLTLQYNDFVEVYSGLTDERTGRIPLNDDTYNIGTLSPDGRFLFISSQLTQRVAAVDLQTRQQVFGPLFLPYFAGGIAVHPNQQKLYLSAWGEDKMMVFDYDGSGQLSNLQTLDLTQQIASGNGQPIAAHEVFFLPDGSRYFVTCLNSNEVRIFDGGSDTLLAAIEVGEYPSEMAFSAAHNRLFVSCMEEKDFNGNDPLKRGTIAVIDLNTNALETQVYTGFQPHGLAVDEAAGYLLVANRNVDPSGPRPHHGSNCQGRNGYLSLLNLSSLQLLADFKPELSVDPYRVVVK